MSDEISYKNAGVDTHKGQEFIQRIKNSVHSTHNPRVLGGLGGFSAAYDLSFIKNYNHPILLSSTDGVGTKIELARLLGIHDTIGIDLVAMCVNDLIVNGAKPLFFLDYIACGKLDTSKMESIVSGIVKGCLQSGTALVGGETAEHPGTMKEDEYDLAGFVVGVVEKDDYIDGSSIQEGDLILGLGSSGPHSNGFSLLRKLYLKNGKDIPSEDGVVDFIKNYLFKPTRIYVESILKLIKKFPVRGMVHITGGGFYENIPRVLHKRMDAILNLSSLPESYTFSKIQRDHSIKIEEMYATFNMGIGFIVIIPAEFEKLVTAELEGSGESVYTLGSITKGNGKLKFI